MNTFEELTELVAARLAENRRVRRNLPGNGRLRIERQLPFICVYRRPPGADDSGTADLISGEAAYVIAPGDAEYRDDVSRLCGNIAATIQECFGACVLIEIWSEPQAAVSEKQTWQPAFEIVAAEASLAGAPVEELAQALGEIRVHRLKSQVTKRRAPRVQPPGLPPLLEQANAAEGECLHVGLEVRPVYRSVDGKVYPLLLQAMRRQLGTAIRKMVFAFEGKNAEGRPAHYHAFGPSRLVKAARRVDQQLAEVSEAFDFLFQVTPVNTESAWRHFRDSRFESEPQWRYRPLPYHPSLLKRQLFDIPIENVEDETLAQLFWEKQEELDHQLTALRHLNTPAFLRGSESIYGCPDAELIDAAHAIFNSGTDDVEEAAAPQAKGDGKTVNARDLAQRARDEIDYYHRRHSSFTAQVAVRDDIASGMLVVKDQLFISNSLRVAARSVAPLLHHEIGTHLLTYHNGRMQSLQLLYAGLAGYESLQEGLAVLAEYLSGGLAPSRFRLLAARVIAIDAMLRGASFIDAYRLLDGERGLAPRSAFTTTLRVFRGGGFTKDVIYLAGLRDVLAYLAQGHDIEPLYVGKMALEHVPHIQELRMRGIVDAAAILPRFWHSNCDVHSRLERCRALGLRGMLDETNDAPEPTGAIVDEI